MSMKINLVSFKKPLWQRHFRDELTAKCLCCKMNSIQSKSFHAGHIVPEHFGGEANILNLLPICGDCNRQMGSKNYLLEWAKDKFNNIIVLDDEYTEYQKEAFLKFENYKIIYKKFIECSSEKQVENLSNIITWLIEKNIINPDRSINEYIEFIKEHPQTFGGSIDNTSRVDEYKNINIKGIDYDKVRLRSHILGSTNPIIELYYTIETTKSDIFPKIVYDGFAYLEYQGPSSRSGCYKFNNYSLWIQPYQCFVVK
jgi:hypothetical protein